MLVGGADRQVGGQDVAQVLVSPDHCQPVVVVHKDLVNVRELGPKGATILAGKHDEDSALLRLPVQLEPTSQHGISDDAGDDRDVCCEVAGVNEASYDGIIIAVDGLTGSVLVIVTQFKRFRQ